MTGFRKISRNVDLWSKMAIFLPKRPKRDFSGEIRKRYFRRIGKSQLRTKNQKNPMNGY